MIATHHPKMFNARLKQPAIRSRITGAFPTGLICSQAVPCAASCGLPLKMPRTCERPAHLCRGSFKPSFCSSAAAHPQPRRGAVAPGWTGALAAPWRGDFVQLEARCEGINVAAGMLAVGWPAITALDGLVHALERQTGQCIEFALGLRSSEWRQELPKMLSLKDSYGAASAAQA